MLKYDIYVPQPTPQTAADIERLVVGTFGDGCTLSGSHIGYWNNIRDTVWIVSVIEKTEVDTTTFQKVIHFCNLVKKEFGEETVLYTVSYVDMVLV